MSDPVLPHEPPTGLNPFGLYLDWWGYWREFKQIHGDPVDLGWCLAFPDGWTYHRRNVSGPEYPPPKDPFEHLTLLCRYWIARKRIIEQERKQLERFVQQLKDLQDKHSAPIMQQMIVVDEETGRKRLVRGRVNPEEIEQGRLAWLRAEEAKCDTKLNLLLEKPICSPQDR